MADFRRCLYALALVALIGLSVSANAQTNMICSANGTVPTIVRAEGFTELTGDVVIDCTGGTPTPVGNTIPQVDIVINLNVNMTSKITATIGSANFLEALLLIDQPNSSYVPTHPILNCGAAGAPDQNPAQGPGVCQIIASDVTGANTYDGTPNVCFDPGSAAVVGPPAISATAASFGTKGTTVPGTGGAGQPATRTYGSANNGYGCGRPNIFQGRATILPGQIAFAAVPIDPPGTGAHRIIRITNVRANANQTGVSLAALAPANITADISANPQAFFPLAGNTTAVVARAQVGLLKFATTSINLIGCTSSNNNVAKVTLTEGFFDAFKPKNIAELFANGTAAAPYALNAGVASGATAPSFATDMYQDVPGASYDTESGFEDSSANVAPPTSNPPPGFGPTTTATNVNLSNGFVGTNTNIANAGIANNGTRFILNFANIPFVSAALGTAVTINVPTQLNLINTVNGNASGEVVLMATGGACLSPTTGAGPSTNACRASATAGSNVNLAISSLGTAVAIYEVVFADPGALEQLTVPVTVTVSPTIISQFTALTSPPTATVSAGFAPTYTFPATPDPRNPQFDTVLPVPRFGPPQAPQNIFNVNGKCTCNLLFPYVTNYTGSGTGTGGSGKVADNYDTAFTIANTSLDPGAAFGFSGLAQSGPVQLWFYSRNRVLSTTNNSVDDPAFTVAGVNQGNTQCTNSTNPGQCPGNVNVPAGGYISYILSGNGTANGGFFASPANGTTAVPVLLSAPNFTGYIVAQASFQYCHGFAYISSMGTPPSTTGFAAGYLALVMDDNLTLTLKDNTGTVTGTATQTSTPGGVPRTISAGEQLNN